MTTYSRRKGAKARRRSLSLDEIGKISNYKEIETWKASRKEKSAEDSESDKEFEYFSRGILEKSLKEKYELDWNITPFGGKNSFGSHYSTVSIKL